MDELLSSGKSCESVRNKEGSLITLKVRCRGVGEGFLYAAAVWGMNIHKAFFLPPSLHKQSISVCFLRARVFVHVGHKGLGVS